MRRTAIFIKFSIKLYFIIIDLRSIVKQVIRTYAYHSRHLIPDVIIYHSREDIYREESLQTQRSMGACIPISFLIDSLVLLIARCIAPRHWTTILRPHLTDEARDKVPSPQTPENIPGGMTQDWTPNLRITSRGLQFRKLFWANSLKLKAFHMHRLCAKSVSPTSSDLRFGHRPRPTHVKLVIPNNSEILKLKPSFQSNLYVLYCMLECKIYIYNCLHLLK